MKLLFATQNSHKLFEIKHLIPSNIELIDLKSINFSEEIPEDFDTLEQNASQKSWFIFNKTGINCFADDTGLEIEALGGKPGVLSARYAGEVKSSTDNVKKVLSELKNISNRNCRFRTIISLIIDSKEQLFEGVVNGKIISKPTGYEGFGYDPIFIPDGFLQTFAEMPISEKNKISHRALAFNKLKTFLEAF
ncbi:MAG: non-canonical purine NTP pyrophosphatase, RdgB/HAM1 family [Bacteroidetes bacterium GWA2_30_7]|nr:MAG: non-canonical purine NTP pyrophosphatase, RdgB/HAM1 family [Bacteroidetes bacterium GWA2_30_7]